LGKINAAPDRGGGVGAADLSGVVLPPRRGTYGPALDVARRNRLV